MDNNSTPKRLSELEAALADYLPTFFHRLQPDSDLYRAVLKGIESLKQGGGLSWSRLNQIFQLASRPVLSEGFYRYYFLEVPKSHPYPVEKVFEDGDDFEPPVETTAITSIRQFQWGLRRFIFDAMLYYGNFDRAYNDLRSRSRDEIARHFESKRFNERHLITRGGIQEPIAIPRDHRYLISEMACKNYEDRDATEETDHAKIVLAAFRELKKQGGKVTSKDLKSRAQEMARQANQETLFDLLYEDVPDEVEDEQQVLALYQGQSEAFRKARATALHNTRIYLSICHDLDAYVATSMRTRQDFREMAAACDEIFQSEVLRQYNVRYFDPTLSAADHHEDKGIIECLMVKAAKLLIYCAQHKESLGKVSEYAMALSLGKPVIILCPSDARGQEIFEFYRDKQRCPVFAPS